MILKRQKCETSVFEQLSGMKINFHKSKIFCFKFIYSSLFGCKLGSYPFRYLGIPMHYRKLANNDWKAIEKHFEKRFSGWSID
jgi:hypothetical protein